MIQSDLIIITKWRRRFIGSFILVITCTILVPLLLPLLSIIHLIHSFSEQIILNLQSLVTLSVLIHATFTGIFYNTLYKNAGVSFGVGVLTLVLSFFAMGIGMFLFTIFLLYKTNIHLKENIKD